MQVERRGRVRKLFPVAGRELEHGFLSDTTSGRRYAIEVPRGMYRPNEIVLYTPGRKRAKPHPRWPNLNPVQVKKA